MKPRNIVLALGVAATLTGLVLSPKTGWLARRQIAMSLGGHLFEGPSQAARRQAVVVEQHPDNFDLQFGGALTAPTSEDVRTRLRALRERFPSRPALYAAILRYDCMGAVRTNRPVEEALWSNKPISEPPASFKSSTSSDLSAFLSDAIQGEALAPENALFPTMQAIALFAEKRDDAALAALHRATQKATWNDYIPEEAEARSVLNQAALGRGGVIVETTQSAMILFPHYAALRSMSRVVLALATKKEQAGDIAGGLTIRQDLQRVGGLMRRDGSTAICNLVGIALTSMAQSHPGGEPNDAIKAIQDDAARATAQRDAYIRYLKSLGKGDAAVEAQRESSAGQTVKKLISRASTESVGLFDMRPMMHLALWWVVSLVALGTVVSTLLLGGLFTWLRKTAWIRAGKPASPGVLLGLTVALGIVPLTVVGLATMTTLPFASAPVFCIVFGLTLVSLWQLLTTTESGQRGKALAATAATVGIAGVLVAITVLGPSQVVRDFIQVASMFTNSVGEGDDTTGTNLQKMLPILSLVVFGLLTWAVPACFAAGIALWSLTKRIPATVGVTRLYARLALPLAAFLVAIYVVLVIQTAQREEQASRALRATITHEGRTLARSMGETWPE